MNKFSPQNRAKQRPKGCEECESIDMPASIYDQIQLGQVNFREIYINGRIDNKLIEKVVIQIFNINRADDDEESRFAQAELSGFKREPITIFINSPGGNVSETFAIVSAIKASKTPVVTVAMGEAMSGGFLILLAGDQRYAQLYSTLMYHDLSSGTGGTAEAIREYSEHLDSLQERLKYFVMENSNIAEEDIDDCHYRKHDWYMDTFKALELGVIDGIWPPEVYVLQEEPESEHECGCTEPCGGCEETGKCGCDMEVETKYPTSHDLYVEN